MPAIWSAAATGFMRNAALECGIISDKLSQNLTLIREPEGACLDFLYGVNIGTKPVPMEVGTEVAIVDCGGGTNDMTFCAWFTFSL